MMRKEAFYQHRANGHRGNHRREWRGRGGGNGRLKGDNYCPQPDSPQYSRLRRVKQGRQEDLVNIERPQVCRNQNNDDGLRKAPPSQATTTTIHLKERLSDSRSRRRNNQTHLPNGGRRLPPLWGEASRLEIHTSSTLEATTITSPRRVLSFRKNPYKKQTTLRKSLTRSSSLECFEGHRYHTFERSSPGWNTWGGARQVIPIARGAPPRQACQLIQQPSVPVDICYGPDPASIMSSILNEVLSRTQPRLGAIGKIIFVGSRKSVKKTSVVHQHIDFMTSNAWVHPALVVQESWESGACVYTCFKITGENSVAHWTRDGGHSVASTLRALLYIPIQHAWHQGSPTQVYSVPMLSQNEGQLSLDRPSFINTERLFKIERSNTLEYRPHGRRGYGRNRSHRQGFSIDVPSLQLLAQFVVNTPMIRHNSRSPVGVRSEHNQPIYLTTRTVILLSQYVQEGDSGPFNEESWRVWLTGIRNGGRPSRCSAS